MTFDEMLDAFGDYDTVPVDAIEAALAGWDEYAPRFRGLLHGYVHGDDLSERTERSLYVAVHLLAERADTASFADLCRLGEQEDRFGSVYGPVGAVLSFARTLAGTFDGDLAPLTRLIECMDAEDYTRCDALLVLTFLACTNRIGEAQVYDYLSRLPSRLPTHESDLWYGYARSVATLGFAGLSGLVDAAYKNGFIDEMEFTAGDFWRDLRETQAAGRDLSDELWSGLQPIDSAVDQLLLLASEEDTGGEGSSFGEAHNGGSYDMPEPIRNPLRSIGRNDPCPCGSGKKYKKCCLQAASP